MKTVILIEGKKRAGKNTVAEKVSEELQSRGIEVRLVSFAEPMKEILADTFEVSKDTIDIAKNEPYLYPIKMVQLREDVDYNKIQTNMRRILQNFGQAVKKHFGQSVWADLLYSKLQDGAIYIVTDWRYIIELETLKSRGDIRIITLQVYNEDVDSSDTHDSENELNDFDTAYTINNSLDHRKYVDGRVLDFITKTKLDRYKTELVAEPFDYFKCDVTC